MPLLRPRVVRADKPGPGRKEIAAGAQDSLLAAIANWIPVEVITVYKAAMGAIPEGWPTLRLGISIASVIVSFFWIVFATRDTGQKVAWRQALLAPVAFTCWAVATQADVVRGFYPDWGAWMAFLVLCGGTILLPILDGILKVCGVTQN